IILNLLSVAAAYGVIVAFFQWGWGEGLLDFHSNGGIANWLPTFMFVILFGLSMDYHVFILSRIREAYDRGLSTDDAISYGIKSTASVVTSAATVMVGVFGVFALLPLVDLKETGLARIGLGLVALHVADDNWLQPNPGTSAGDHVLAGLVPFAAVVAGIVFYPRLHAGARAVVTLVGGFLGVLFGTEAVYYTSA